MKKHIVINGERLQVEIADKESHILSNRGPGLHGQFTDLKSGRTFRRYGKSCGLKNCWCDARYAEVGPDGKLMKCEPTQEAGSHAPDCPYRQKGDATAGRSDPEQNLKKHIVINGERLEVEVADKESHILATAVLVYMVSSQT